MKRNLKAFVFLLAIALCAIPFSGLALPSVGSSVYAEDMTGEVTDAALAAPADTASAEQAAPAEEASAEAAGEVPADIPPPDIPADAPEHEAAEIPADTPEDGSVIDQTAEIAATGADTPEQSGTAEGEAAATDAEPLDEELLALETELLADDMLFALDEDMEILAEEGLEVDEENFPDDLLRGYIEGLETDADGDKGILTDEEIAAVTSLYLRNIAIQDLTGIENFTSLEILSVYNTRITTLPTLTALTNLKSLFCTQNRALSKVQALPSSLTRLNCEANALNALDLSPLVNLSTFTGGSQTPAHVTVYANGPVYEAAVPLTAPVVFENTAVTYEGGNIIIGPSKPPSSPFSVGTGKDGLLLWGTMTFAAYRGELFFKVDDISGIPTRVTEDVARVFRADISPANATNTTVVWDVVDAGRTGARFRGAAGNSFYATAPGRAVVSATVEGGSGLGKEDYVQEFTITVIAAPATGGGGGEIVVEETAAIAVQTAAAAEETEITDEEVPLASSPPEDAATPEPVQDEAEITDEETPLADADIMEEGPADETGRLWLWTILAIAAIVIVAGLMLAANRRGRAEESEE